MDVSVMGIVLLCGLAVVASMSAGFVRGRVAARRIRRRHGLRLVVGGKAALPALHDPRRPRRRVRTVEVAAWREALPVTQWQRPRAHDSEPSPAA